MKGKLIFKEEQSFVGTWMWYLVIGISLVSVGGTALAVFYRQDTEGIVGLIIAAIVTGGLVMLFIFSKLHISIDQENLYYRYPPFVNKEKKITKDDVKEIYIRQYSPIMEYGGWGYRISIRNGKALNVVGNTGLQLVTKNDKRILLGTQKSDELERAVRRLKENWGIDG
ncbi:hypothetical protein [Ekhidna sp.]|uniref:hypothetical protein n=1 Tax=Ekhidna sp. TaxID=2608089 RepID=UPI003514119D